jgi:hypothetical protein
MNDWQEYMHNILYHECLLLSKLNVTVLVLRRVKISLRLWNYCNDGITRVVVNLRIPTGHSRDILLQAKGITGIESTQIRWFSR